MAWYIPYLAGWLSIKTRFIDMMGAPNWACKENPNFSYPRSGSQHSAETTTALGLKAKVYSVYKYSGTPKKVRNPTRRTVILTVPAFLWCFQCRMYVPHPIASHLVPMLGLPLIFFTMRNQVIFPKNDKSTIFSHARIILSWFVISHDILSVFPWYSHIFPAISHKIPKGTHIPHW